MSVDITYSVTLGGVQFFIEVMTAKRQKKLIEYCQNVYGKYLKWDRWELCNIMHGNEHVASIDKYGKCTIYFEELMPYNLYLEECPETDMDTRMQNLDNFNHWCASRVLTLEREYAKEILNSIGATQTATDRERAKIALSYHCLSLTDVYWTKKPEEMLDFTKINLYENSLGSAFVDISLRGKQISIQNSHLIADDLGTQGCFPKAWYRYDEGIYLLKDGGIDVVEKELLASKICRCFDVKQVFYEESYFDGQKVSSSKLITSRKFSIVPMEYYEIYLVNKGTNKRQAVLELDAYSYYMMNIVDYLIGNTDRHWGNWGILVDNVTNEPVRLHDLMDFNKAFGAYDTIEGANCLTCLSASEHMSQKEAAIEAVQQIGLNQIAEVKAEWFADDTVREMFFERLEVLKEAAVFHEWKS